MDLELVLSAAVPLAWVAASSVIKRRLLRMASQSGAPACLRSC